MIIDSSVVRRERLWLAPRLLEPDAEATEKVWKSVPFVVEGAGPVGGAKQTNGHGPGCQSML